MKKVIILKDECDVLNGDGMAFSLRGLAKFLNEKIREVDSHEAFRYKGTLKEMYDMIDYVSEMMGYSVEWYDIDEVVSNVQQK